MCSNSLELEKIQLQDQLSALRVEQRDALEQMASTHEAQMKQVGVNQESVLRDVNAQLGAQRGKIEDLQAQLKVRCVEAEELRAQLGARCGEVEELRAQLEAQHTKAEQLKSACSMHEALVGSYESTISATKQELGNHLQEHEGRQKAAEEMMQNLMRQVEMLEVSQNSPHRRMRQVEMLEVFVLWEYCQGREGH